MREFFNKLEEKFRILSKNVNADNTEINFYEVDEEMYSIVIQIDKFIYRRIVTVNEIITKESLLKYIFQDIVTSYYVSKGLYD